MQGRTIVVRMANSTAQFNWLKWVGIVKSFKAGNNVGVFMHDPQVVWEVARAQCGTRIKEDSQLHVVSRTKAEMDMGKAIVNMDWHRAQWWACGDILLEGANKEGQLADTLGRMGEWVSISWLGGVGYIIAGLVVVLPC
jgi:hypothetical protein